MCGLFGYYLVRPDRRVIPLGAALSVLMDLRGDDSWGYYAYQWDHREKKTDLLNPIYEKGLGTFASGVAARSLRNCTMLMAHSRSASVGDPTLANAHPFAIGNVVGAHNGAVFNHRELNKDYKRNFEVDSMHIFKHLDENKPVDDIHGYGAITYVDTGTDPQKIHLCRWNGGQLTTAQVYTRDGERLGVVWASLESSLQQSLDVAGFNGNYKLRKVEEDQAYFVGLSEGGDAAPDFWTLKGKKYPFGNRSWTDVTNASTDDEDDDKDEKNIYHMMGHQMGYQGPTRTGHVWSDDPFWCEVCFVLDKQTYHPNAAGDHSIPPQITTRRSEARNEIGSPEIRAQALELYHKEKVEEGVIKDVKYRVAKTSNGVLSVHFDDGKTRCILCFTKMGKVTEKGMLICDKCYPDWGRLLKICTPDVKTKALRACLKASGVPMATVATQRDVAAMN